MHNIKTACAECYRLVLPQACLLSSLCAVPFVTEKVGYSMGLVPVEVGDDPDGKPLTHIASPLNSLKLWAAFNVSCIEC